MPHERERFRQPVKLFLSHSKHDKYGITIADAIRDYLHKNKELRSFFDVHDIASGSEFDIEILDNIRVCAFVAVHTDSYSSREWCRREVLEAKRHHVPAIVINSIDEAEERAFPYLGNVPVLRVNPNAISRLDVVIGAVLTEVLRDYLWRCWVKQVEAYVQPTDFFVPRAPELLIFASSLGETPINIIYPEPPISAEEEILFQNIRPGTKLFSMRQWIADRGL